MAKINSHLAFNGKRGQPLDQKDLQILHFIFRGDKPNKIAERTGSTTHSVNSRLKLIRQKTASYSTPEAIYKAIRLKRLPVN